MAVEVALLEACGVSLDYAPRRGRLARRLRPAPPAAPALVDARVAVAPGECLGIVGESGSGKTTLANCLTGLAAPTAGEVRYRGEVVNRPGGRPRIPRARGIQIVFQDPYSSLNPRRSVGSVLGEVLRAHRLRPRGEIGGRIDELLDEVGLAPEQARLRPHQLSGGQRQRVAIARALAFEPEVVVADEIVSALDASVQAQILNLLGRLRAELGLTVVFITHDLAVVRQVCDRVVVMTAGRIVETGTVSEVLDHPSHRYTRELLAAVPRLEAAATVAS